MRPILILCFAFLNAPTEAEESWLEGIWDLPSHHFEKGASVESFAFTGVVHYQYASVSTSQGDASDSEFRRFRFGLRSKLLDYFLISGMANFDPEEGTFYDGLSTVYLTYSPYGNSKREQERFSVSLGKLKPRFSREYSNSAKRIKTFERSLLVNQLAPSKATGIWLQGSDGDFSWVVSGFSGDDADEFSNFRDGALLLGKLGYDFTESWNLGFDYMAGIAGQQITASIDHAFSLSVGFNEKYRSGGWSILADAIYASGKDAPDSFGFVFLPSYKVTDWLELVGRYHFASSTHGEGIRLQRRYERLPSGIADGGRGERYHSGYFGANFWVHGDQFRIMTGLEYAHMEGSNRDYEGWTLMTGVRIYF